MAKVKTLEDLFEAQLHDIYWAEGKLSKALAKMSKKAPNAKLASAFAKHKEEYAKDFDVMIEDDAGNANAMAPQCTVILINRSWNREVTLHENVIVAEDWPEVEFIIEHLDKFKKT